MVNGTLGYTCTALTADLVCPSLATKFTQIGGANRSLFRVFADQ